MCFMIASLLIVAARVETVAFQQIVAISCDMPPTPYRGTHHAQVQFGAHRRLLFRNRIGAGRRRPDNWRAPSRRRHQIRECGNRKDPKGQAELKGVRVSPIEPEDRALASSLMRRTEGLTPHPMRRWRDGSVGSLMALADAL
jgi:hypothetical protein